MSRQTPAAFADRLRIEQAQPYQCDLLVWRNASGLLGPLGHPGHAALVLRRTIDEGPWWGKASLNFGLGPIQPEIDPTRQRYISFWPYGEKEGLSDAVSATFHSSHLQDMRDELGDTARQLLSAGQSNPRLGQVVIGQDRDLNDIWGQRHGETVPMPGLTGLRPDRLGLSLNRMVQWAARFRDSDEYNYIFASKHKNCAGVAVRALQAGGADAFASLGGSPAQPSVYMLPNDAQRWANAVHLGIAACNRMLEVLRNRTAFMAKVSTDLMTVAEWKKKTAVALALRGRLTSNIDKALKEYHEKDWGTDFTSKLKRLLIIIQNVHDHLREITKRDTGYLILAHQVMSVVDTLARSGDAHWHAGSYYGTKHSLG